MDDGYCDVGPGTSVEAEVKAAYAKKFFKRLQSENESKVIRAIDEFVKYIRKGKGNDVVLNVLSSPLFQDVSLLTDQLKIDNRPVTEIILIFQCWKAIFLRLGSDLSQFKNWGLHFAEHLEDTKLFEVFYQRLTPNNTQENICIIFDTLTSMVESGADVARVVFSCIAINEQLLLDFLKEDELRASVIKYLLSYVISQDSSLINEVLKGTELWTIVFSKLLSDKSSTVVYLLETLAKLVEYPGISRKELFNFFNFENLKCIVKLSEWSPPESEVPPSSEKLIEEETSLVHQSALKFFQNIYSCGKRNAIAVGDPSVGTSGQNCNPYITKLIVSSSRKLLQSQFLGDLFIIIGKACPDQIVHCVSVLKHSQCSAKAVAFVTKMIEVQEPIKVLALALQNKCRATLVNIALTVTTANALTTEVLNGMITDDAVDVRHCGVAYVSVILTKFVSVVHDPHKLMCSSFPSRSEYDAFYKEYTRVFLKFFPERDAILNCLTLALNEIASKLKQQTRTENVIERGDDVLLNHLEVVLSVIATCIRNRLGLKLTAFITDNLFSVLSRVRHESIAKIFLMIFECVVYFVAANHINLHSLGRSNCLVLICDVVDLNLHSVSTSKKVFQLLSDLLSMKFRKTKFEVDIWLRTLKCYLHLDRSGILKFFADVVFNLFQNYSILMMNVAQTSASSKKQDMDRCSDILDAMLSLDDHQQDAKCLNHVKVTVDYVTYSPMVLSALSTLEKHSSFVCKKFVASVLTDVVHGQQKPSALLSVIDHHRQLLPKHFVNYADLLQQPQPSGTILRKEMKMLSAITNDRRDLAYLVRESFVKRKDFDRTEETLKLLAGGVPCEDVPLLCSQILLYMLLLTEANLDVAVCHKLIPFYCDLLRELVSCQKEAVSDLVLSHLVIRNRYLQGSLSLESHKDAHVCAITSLVNYVVVECAAVPTHVATAAYVAIGKWLHLVRQPEFKRMRFPLLDTLPLDRFAAVWSMEDLLTLVSVIMDFSASNLVKMKKGKLTDAGKLFLHLIAAVSSRQGVLSGEQVSSISRLYRSMCELLTLSQKDGWQLQMSQLGRTLSRILAATPLQVVLLDADFLVFCLESATSEDLEMATVTLDYDVTAFNHLKRWLLKTEVWEQQPAKYAGIVLRFLTFVVGSRICPRTFKSPEMQELTSKLLRTYWRLVTRLGAKDVCATEQTLVIYAMLVKVIHSFEFVSSKKRRDYFKQFSDITTSDEVTTVDLCVLCEVVWQTPSNESSVRGVAIQVILVKFCLMKLETYCVSDMDGLMTDVNVVIDLVTNVLNDNLSKYELGRQMDLDTATWNRLFKFCLRRQTVDGRKMLQVFRSFLERLRANGELGDSFLYAFFEAFTTRKCFVTRMVSTESYDLDWKTSALDLLLFLAETSPSVFAKLHVSLLWKIYSFTTSAVDDKILTLLFLYERHNKLEVNHEVVLRSLNENKLLHTSLHFPLELGLDIRMDRTTVAGCNTDGDIYDPRFLLALLCRLVHDTDHQSVVSQSNLLPLAFASLSSANAGTRAAGYYVLSCLLKKLNFVKTDKKYYIWWSLLKIVKNSVCTRGQRFPTVFTVFLVKICHSLAQNATALTLKPVLAHTWQQSRLDADALPAFALLFKRFKETDLCLWILDVWEKGLRTEDDIVIYQKKNIFNAVCCFLFSPHLSHLCKIKVLNIVKAAMKLTVISHSHSVLHQYFLVLMHDVVKKNDADVQVVTVVLEALHESWTILNVTPASEKKMTSISMTLLTETYMLLSTLLDWIASHLRLFEHFCVVLALVFSKLCKKYSFRGNRYDYWMTTTSVNKLLNCYEEVVKSKLGVSENCKKAMFTILNWWCDSKKNVADMEDERFVGVLSSSLVTLLHVFPPCEENLRKLSKIFGLMAEYLSHDTLGLLFARLLQHNHLVIDVLLQSYEFLLLMFKPEKSIDFTRSGNIYNGTLQNRRFVLHNLNAVFIAMARCSDDFFENATNEVFAAMCKLKETLMSSDVQEIMRELKNTDEHIVDFSAVTVALVICDRLMRKTDSSNVCKFLEFWKETLVDLNVVTIRDKGVVVNGNLKRKENRVSERSAKRRKKNPAERNET